VETPDTAKDVPTDLRASARPYQLKVIVYFTEEELLKVRGILEDLKLTGDRDIILIDARSDNKPSGSKA
jgi:hypothetical protein